MPLRYTALLFALLLPLAPEAQTGTCARAEAETYLENSGVRALLFGDGALFWRGGDHIYEVPKGSGKQAVFAGSIWIGGEIGGESRFAGTDYGPYEYWPGPLAADGGPPSDESCEQHDRLWRVTLEDIARYNATGDATDDLAEWPHEVGAPVVDGDGDPMNYDLAAGDRPAIVGDETVWWIMNDRGNTHNWGDTDPIGLEVRVTAFSVSEAYARQRLRQLDSVAKALHVSTFYRYELTYRGDAPFENVYLGTWMDPDLGFFSDDYVGSYPPQNIAYVYNGDDFDEGSGGYGFAPPALGVQMLDGPSTPLMGTFIYYNGDGSVQGNPSNGRDAYLYLQGRWRDGTSITYGGTGYQTGEPTDYMFPDVPPGFWSEFNIDGLGTDNTPSDRRLLASQGPFTMQPGETVRLSFALVFSRSEQGNVASVRQLLFEDSPFVAAIGRTIGPDPDLASITLSQLPVPLPEPPETPEAPERYAAAETVWPNPASGETTLRLDLPDAADVRLTVYDALGRRVATPQDGPLAGAKHRLPIQTAGWAPGVYVYRLAITPEAGGAPIEADGRFVVVR